MKVSAKLEKLFSKYCGVTWFWFLKLEYFSNEVFGNCSTPPNTGP
jgi:hypothetical protein